MYKKDSLIEFTEWLSTYIDTTQVRVGHALRRAFTDGDFSHFEIMLNKKFNSTNRWNLRKSFQNGKIYDFIEEIKIIFPK